MGRRRAAKGSWPVHARLANVGLGLALRARHRVRVRDIGPMRAARREALLELGIVDRRFGWPLEMVVRAADKGWRITEVDVPYHPRLGRSKVTGTVKGTIEDGARHGGRAALTQPEPTEESQPTGMQETVTSFSLAMTRPTRSAYRTAETPNATPVTSSHRPR